MAKPDELHNDAWSSYKEGKFCEAAMIFLQASDLARELRDAAGWHEYRVSAAECYRIAGEQTKAMNLLLDARMHEPSNRSNYAAWIACKKAVDITLSINPIHSKIISFINELKELYEKQTAPISDVLSLEGDILFERGLFIYALNKFQEAWSSYNENISGGYHKCTFAENAAYCCLRLEYLEQAKDWINSLKTAIQNTGWFAIHGALEIHLALLDAKPFFSLPGLLRQLDDQTQLMQDNDSKDSCNMLAVRVALLTNSDLDPMHRHHPSRPPLMQRLRNVKNVHNQYKYRLLLLDVRLAALRFCAGIAPVDDLYYAKPQQFSVKKNNIDMEQLKIRMRKALQAARQAEHYGAKIDAMLECDWRQKEVQERRRRVIEIAHHHNLDAGISES